MELNQLKKSMVRYLPIRLLFYFYAVLIIVIVVLPVVIFGLSYLIGVVMMNIGIAIILVLIMISILIWLINKILNKIPLFHFPEETELIYIGDKKFYFICGDSGSRSRRANYKYYSIHKINDIKQFPFLWEINCEVSFIEDFMVRRKENHKKRLEDIDDNITSTQTVRIGKYYNSINRKELEQLFDQLKTNPE